MKPVKNVLLASLCLLSFPCIDATSARADVPFYQRTAPPDTSGLPVRSIRTFGAACDGRTDDRDVLQKAITAAQHKTFKLLIDCPMFIHTGMDIGRPIYIENETTIEFARTPNNLPWSQNGQFTVDNVLTPAFVMVNVHDINLIGWKIEYRGGTPVDWLTGGYYNNGIWVPSTGRAPSTGSFNDIARKNYMARYKGVTFNRVNPVWSGPANASAIVSLWGSVSNLYVKNFYLFVGKNAKGSQFAPMVFSSNIEWKSWQAVDNTTPVNGTYAAVPRNIVFDGVALDGYYMGFQGKFQNTTFKTIRGYRYGDLQDDNGGTIGGVGKWFPPPHLFYINYDITQTGLDNQNLVVQDVIDVGTRVGAVRDVPGTPGSGYANSLKIGGNNVIVDHYVSYRPDGFADILGGRNMTFQNVYATYDSSFLGNLYSSLRFPVAAPYSYQGLTMKNITLIDTAAVTSRAPVASSTVAENSNVTIDINATINKWANGRTQTPVFTGTGINLNVRYTVLNP